jgi:hypothetical protein
MILIMATDSSLNAGETQPITDPFAGALTAKLDEYDAMTEFLVNPEAGSKIVKSGDRFYFQAPGLTQGLYRWLTGESRDTTREYLEELAQNLAEILNGMQRTIESLTLVWKSNHGAKFGRVPGRPVQQVLDTVSAAEAEELPGLLSLLDIRPTRERIEEISGLLKKADVLTARVLTATEHVQQLYDDSNDCAGPDNVPSAAPSCSSPSSSSTSEVVASENVDGSPDEKQLSYAAMIQSVRSAHAALCQTCSLLQS